MERMLEYGMNEFALVTTLIQLYLSWFTDSPKLSLTFFFFGKPVIWQCTITAVYVFEFSNSETFCDDLSSGCIHNTTDRNSALSTRAYLEHPSPRALTRDQPRNPFCQEPRHLSKPVHEGRPLLEGE